MAGQRTRLTGHAGVWRSGNQRGQADLLVRMRKREQRADYPNHADLLASAVPPADVRGGEHIGRHVGRRAVGVRIRIIGEYENVRTVAPLVDADQDLWAVPIAAELVPQIAALASLLDQGVKLVHHYDCAHALTSCGPIADSCAFAYLVSMHLTCGNSAQNPANPIRL